MTTNNEKRCQRRDTRAFVAPETVDLLGEKMIRIVADRRMTKMHRYLRAQAGTPRLFPGLRVWHGGLSGPTTLRPRQSASISLASHQHPIQGIGFSVSRLGETEEQVRGRYNYPERRDITLVELRGRPGSPSVDDQIRIEHWPENGIGQETILVFDDIDPVQEIAWIVKGDTLRQVYMDDEYCTVHGQHAEDPAHDHQYGCVFRSATLTENLAVLALLAQQSEERNTRDLG